MSKVAVCIGKRIPRIPGNTVYLTLFGENPLPNTFPIYYLPVILKSLELDGWLSRREINELLELSSGLKSGYINFEKLEALWGEPFKTIRMFFYGKGILIENGKTLSFWVSQLFATLSAALVALLHKDVLVIAWMDIFNNNQKNFIFNLLMERSAKTFVCFINKRDRSLAITDHLIIDVNNINDVQLNVPLKYPIERIDGEFIELNKVNGLWMPTGKVYDSLIFRGGCIPRRPPEVNYLEELFGKEATLVYEILDELFNNMPLSLSIFLNILKEYFKNSKKAAGILRSLLSFKIISISQANVYLTERGVNFYEKFSKS